ncbi:MAG: hypothetical protein WCK58_17585, partial [Chloroflexota bacterium]
MDVHRRPPSGLTSVGRIIAVVVGLVWIAPPILGGMGLLLGPAAWAAALSARRLPVLAAALLCAPAGFLAWIWAPIFASGASLEMLPLAVALVGPAFLAAGLILAGASPPRS